MRPRVYWLLNGWAVGYAGYAVVEWYADWKEAIAEAITLPDRATRELMSKEEVERRIFGQMEIKKSSGLPTICMQCRYCLLDYLGIAGSHRCHKMRANFVYGGMLGFRPCAEVNVDGKCAMFEPKLIPAPKPSLWSRLWGRK